MRVNQLFYTFFHNFLSSMINSLVLLWLKYAGKSIILYFLSQLFEQYNSDGAACYSLFDNNFN